MFTDNAELFSLFRAYFSINSFNYFFICCFNTLRSESGHIGDLLRRIFEYVTDDIGRSLAENVRKNAVELEIGNGQAIFSAVLFSCGEVCEFGMVTNQVPKLTDCPQEE